MNLFSLCPIHFILDSVRVQPQEELDAGGGGGGGEEEGGRRAEALILLIRQFPVT